MHRKIYRNSFFLALAFSILFYAIFALIFLNIRNTVFPNADAPMPDPMYSTFIKHLVFNFTMTLLFSFILFVLNFKVLSLEIKFRTRILFLVL
jgi:hypothetical protein